MLTAVPFKPGETHRITLPWSEVCLHMKVNDKTMSAKLAADGRTVQLFRDDNTPFSYPVLRGEAGIYEREGKYHGYLHDR